MAITNNVTMQHSLVNSGTAVILQNGTVSYSWANLTRPDPIEGKYDLSETEYGGFENPKISINGYFDVEDIDTNELTQKLLVDFATLQSTTPIVLSVPMGDDSSPTYLGGRPSGGYQTDGTNTLSNSINFVIETFDISIDGGRSDQGRFVNYSITGHEAI